MSRRNGNTAIAGVGVAACAVCCVGPILGVLAAIGLGTAAGLALFGTVAIVVGAAAAAFVVIRRRRRANGCTPVGTPPAVPVELTDARARS
jgi:mercuric ion transport protein